MSSLLVEVGNNFASASTIEISGTGAIIGNGNLILGVNNAGHLNVDYRASPTLGLPATDPALIGKVGLRNGAGDLPSIEPECLCEGWGIATLETAQSGYANEGLGSGNIEVLSFLGTDGADSALSHVLAYNRLEVTHDYHPSGMSSYLYEVLVTVKNVGEIKMNTTLYRRVMDWDSYPTPLIEFVTIKGTGETPNLVGSGNNGFLTSDILSSTKYGTGVFGGLSINSDFEDFGPDDQGSVFDFELGPLAPGESTTIRTYYGVAPDEQAALAALDAVGAQLYSFGQSNENGTPNNDGTTFIYAFAADAFEAPQERQSDFNGDGYEDLAIGVPNEDIGSVADAGAVNVIYGSSSGLSTSASSPDQLLHQNLFGTWGIAQPGDHFGSAKAFGDFNSDGFDDLAIGVPGKDLDTQEDAGAVNVIYGSSSGLSVSGTIAAQTLNKQVQELDGDITSFDHFGSSLAVGDFNNDGFDDLAIGSPLDIRSDSLVGGTVNIIYGSAAGLSVINNPDQMLANADIGFASSLAAGDFNNDGFDDLAIGNPSADLVSGYDAGVVFILHGSPSGLPNSYSEILHQEDLGFFSSMSKYFGSNLAAGDFNNDGFDDLAISSATEGSSQFTGVLYLHNIGTVSVVYGSSSGVFPSSGENEPQRWNQNSAGIKGTGEKGDNFGSALSAGDFNGDGYVDLAVGVPGDDVAASDDAGAVNIIYGTSDGLKADPITMPPSGREDQLWNQNSLHIRATPEARDYFGQSLTTGDFNNDGYWDLAIGVPGEDINNNATPDTGMVNVIYGSSNGLDALTIPNQAWYQNSPFVEGLSESGDNFGLVLLSGSTQ